MPAAPPNPTWPVYFAIGLAVLANIISIVGWFVVNGLTKHREAQRDRMLREEKSTDDRRRQDEQSRTIFNSAICELKAQIGKVDNQQFQDWFSDMQVEVEKQCALVENAVRLTFRKDFVAARKRCAEPQTQNDLMDARAPIGQLPCGLDRLPDVTYERGRTRARGVLDSLLSASK
jgi:hypothetical protein